MSREGSSSSRPHSAGLEAVPQAGEIIALKYRVERVLGVGGMGVVLAARHLQLGQLVAIKFMRGAAVEDVTAVERFLREARAAVALSSEHVTKVLDVGTLETGEPYMIMEFLDGVDFAQVLRRDGPMSVAGAVGAILQACEALAEAHALGIVHRDLKPANLFVTARRDGTQLVKVLDFGISKMTDLNADGGPTLTASGLIMGSPGYMSPEQVRDAKAADARSDIWALGVILYELLTGVSPFVGKTMGDTFARIISETPTPIRRLRPDVPEAFAAVISACWERKIERRIQTIAGLAERLSPFAPREAELSIERILRIARTPSAVEPAPQETLAAPAWRPLIPDSAHNGESSSRPQINRDTGRAWLKSGSGSLVTRSPSVRVRSAAIVVAGFVALAGAWILVARGARGPATPSVVTTASGLPATASTGLPRTVAPPPPVAPATDGPLAPDAGDAPSPIVSAPASTRREPAAPTPPARPVAPKPRAETPLENLLERRQ